MQTSQNLRDDYVAKSWALAQLAIGSFLEGIVGERGNDALLEKR